MKVIFDDSFLSKASELDCTLKISSYVLANYYKNITSVSELFSLSYLNGDVDKSNKYEITGGIWEEDKKILRLNITIAEDEKENLSEHEPNFIYCYYNEIGSEQEKIAFILSGDLAKTDTTYNIEPLNLSINNNLIDIIFPSSVVANITSVQDEDTKFLEGYGVEIGANMFSENLLEDEPETTLISRSSYYKYLRNNKSSGVSEELPYLNILGEKIYSTSEFIVYNNITLITENAEIYNEEYRDFSLSGEGGEIQLLGTYERTRYTVCDDNIINSVEERGNLLDLDDVIIERVDVSGGLTCSINNETKKVTYGKSNNPNNSLYANLQVVARNYNPTTKRVVVKRSNTLRLNQGLGDSDWEIISNTPYTEKVNDLTYYLYLLDGKANSTQSFAIETNLIVNDIESEVKITADDDRVFDFFKVDVRNFADGLWVDITALKENTNPDRHWNPYVEIKEEEEEIGTISEPEEGSDEETEEPIEPTAPTHESKLIRITIEVKEVRSESFYVVQGPQVGGLSMYNKISTNNYTELEENRIILKTNEISYVYPGKLDDSSDNNYWVLLNQYANIEVSPENGLLNSKDTTSWDSPGEDGQVSSPNRIRLSTERSTEYTSNIALGNLTFVRVKDLEETIDYTNWRDVIEKVDGTYELNAYLKGNDPSISVNTHLDLENLGCYYFDVRSNCPFETEIDVSSDYSSNISVSFDGYSYSSIDGYLTTVLKETHNDYDNTTGTRVFVYLLENTIDRIVSVDFGKIKVKPVGSDSEVIINMHLTNPIDNVLEYYSPDGDKTQCIFFGGNIASGYSSTNNIYYTYNKTINEIGKTQYNNLFNIAIGDEQVNITKKQTSGGYNYSYRNIKVGVKAQDQWPAKYVGNVSMIGTSNTVHYNLFKLGYRTPSLRIGMLNLNIDSASGSSISNIPVYSGLALSLADNFSIALNQAYYNKYSGKVAATLTYRGVSGSQYLYYLTVIINQVNDSDTDRYVGEITISSKIHASDFINSNSGVPSSVSIPTFTQEMVNEIVPNATAKLKVYQKGKTDPMEEFGFVPATTFDLPPEGGYRLYNIKAPTRYSISARSLSNFATLTVDKSLNRGTFTLNPRAKTNILIDKSLVDSSGDKIFEEYSSYYESRIAMGEVKISGSVDEGLVVMGFDPTVTQLGYETAVIYGSDSYPLKLEMGDPETKTETVSHDATSFSFFLGISDGWNGLVDDDDVGIELPELTPIDDFELTSEAPIFRTGFGANPIKKNVTVSFPENTNDNAITRRLQVNYSDGNSFREFLIYITQEGKPYTFVSSVGKSVYFNSSGHCVMNDSELDVIDPAFETDMPSDRMELKVVKVEGDKKTDTDLLKDHSIDLVGPGSNGLTKYKIKGILKPNKSSAPLKDYEIALYDTETDQIKYSWSIKQGFLFIHIDYGGQRWGDGSTLGSDQDRIEVPARSALEGERVIFSVRAETSEYVKNEDGTWSLKDNIYVPEGGSITGEEENLDGFYVLVDCNLDSEYGYDWTSSMGDINFIFRSHQTIYAINDTDSNYNDSVPFLEHRYETVNYINQEVPFDVTVNLVAKYKEPINENSENYTYKFKMLKVAGADTTLEVSEDNFSVPKEGGSIEFTVTCNYEYSVRNNNSDWITGEPIDTNTYTYTILPNETEFERSGSLTITSGDKSVTVSVTQLGTTTREKPQN